MKVALVHDWLTGMRGGEKVLESLCDLFPEAPIYTLIHIRGSVSEKIESHPIRTSFVSHAPLIRRHYRNYLPLFPKAIEQFELRDFDLIISSSHCVAKGVIPRPTATHICYCHTPMRYIWSHHNDYLGSHRIALWKRMLLPSIVNYLRSWDVASSQRVNQFISNSHAVADRIRRYYGRESTVIYPPVDVEFFAPSGESREDFFLIVTALVPYKRIDLAVEAFNRLGYRLKIAGSGTETKKLKRMAGPNIEFLGRVESGQLRELYRKAIALIQPGEEDFGIGVVEALACECPVIAYGRGGALESVQEPETGLFFNDLSVASLTEIVDRARTLRFNKSLMRESALRFSPERFNAEFQSFIHKI